MSEAQLLRRIDRNTVSGDKTRMLEIVMSDKSKTHFLYRVGGICIGVITGTSQFGDWQKLVGRFKAQNADGDVFVSASAFLPGDVSQIISNKLAKPDAEQVTFLYDVFVRFDSKLATNYGFIVEPVRKPDEADPLDALFSEAKSLPAPQTKQLEHRKTKGPA